MTQDGKIHPIVATIAPGMPAILIPQMWLNDGNGSGVISA